MVDARGLVLSLSGHLLSERPQLHREGTRPRAGAAFRKNDNAFLAVADPQALQAAADRFTPQSSANGSTTGRSCWDRSSPGASGRP